MPDILSNANLSRPASSLKSSPYPGLRTSEKKQRVIDESSDEEPQINSSGDEDIHGTESSVELDNRRNFDSEVKHRGVYRSKH
jgi:hypothetical protein